MKIKFNKKNPLFAFVLSILLLAGTMLISAPAANADTSNPISLYYSDTVSSYAGLYQKYIYFKVENLAYSKDVTVHYHYDYNNEWKTQKAEFVASLDSNYDIFTTCLISNQMDDYYVTYTVNGSTYTLYPSHDILGDAKVKALRTSYPSPSSYEVSAVIKESGDLKVVYTTDNWKTVKEENLSYDSDYDNGYRKYSTRLNLGNSDDVYANFQYAICFTINGHEYWDNNFGKNFDSSYLYYAE